MPHRSPFLSQRLLPSASSRWSSRACAVLVCESSLILSSSPTRVKSPSSQVRLPCRLPIFALSLSSASIFIFIFSASNRSCCRCLLCSAAHFSPSPTIALVAFPSTIHCTFQTFAPPHQSTVVISPFSNHPGSRSAVERCLFCGTARALTSAATRRRRRTPCRCWSPVASANNPSSSCPFVPS